MSYPYDPEYLPLMEFIPALDVSDAAAVRTLVRSMGADDPMTVVPDTVRVDRRSVPSADGAEVEIVVFSPRDRGDDPLPGILYFHGGGFVFGDANTDVRMPSRLAADLGAVVASVNYRLAPEHPFPAPVDDGFAALTWFAGTGAADFGVNVDRIAVAGISAGAGLSAAVALRARDQGGPALVFQALDCPVLDDRLTTESMQYTDTPLWTRQNAVDSWNHYLGTSDRGEVSLYAAPARAESLAGLPPAYIAVTAFDPLRDEGIDYARRLIQAGVAAELSLTAGTFHGSSGVFPQAAISVRINDDYVNAIRRALTA